MYYKNMIEKIPIKPYKAHQGEIRQYGYKGIALNPIEQALTLKLNEIIDELNGN
jgi:hypothetical protein